MVQLMPLPLTVSCSSKIQIGLPFWYRLTRVVPEKGPLNECVCSNMEIITYCRKQFNFELPSVILARHTSLFLDKLRHC